MNVFTVSIFLITYLITSISPAIEICKKRTGEDIRNLGSGNAGTTNAIRVMGRLWGAIVFILDIVKVFLAYGVIYLVAKIFKQNMSSLFYSIFLVAVVLGHTFPVYYKFKGGKGVAVALVAGYILNSQAAIVCLIAAVVIILLTRMVSMGSIGGILLYCIMTLVMMPQYLIAVLIVTLVIMLKHIPNIRRIMQGQENKLF